MKPLNSTTIIMPAYNVDREIQNLLLQMTAYKKDIIIIDDGSTDNTYKIIKSLNYNVIRKEKNEGVASALRTGIDYAINCGYQNAIFMDSDGQHSPSYIDKFLYMLNDYDFVSGNRFHKNTIAPDIKLASNLLASMIVYRIWGKKYNDISCGFKAIRLSKDINLAIKESKGYSIVFDLFFYAFKHDYRIGTIEVDAIYDYSTFQMTRSEEILAFIFALKQNISENVFQDLNIDNLIMKLMEKRDFSYSIDNIMFCGFYIPSKNGYIMQADPVKLRKYLTLV